MAFSPDGKLLATGTPSRAIFWPLPHLSPQIKLWDEATGQLLATMTSNAYVVPELKFSPTGNFLWARGYCDTATSNGWDKPLYEVWDVPNRKLLSEVDRLWPYVFVDNEKRLVSLVRRTQGSAEVHWLQTWDVATMRPLETTTLWELPADHMVNRLVISPDAGYIAGINARLPRPTTWQTRLAALFPWFRTDGISYELRVYVRRTGGSFDTLTLGSSDPTITKNDLFFSRDILQLFTIHSDRVSVWDLPLRKPWWHILPWPLLPAGIWLAWRWWRLRRKVRAANAGRMLEPRLETG